MTHLLSLSPFASKPQSLIVWAREVRLESGSIDLQLEHLVFPTCRLGLCLLLLGSSNPSRLGVLCGCSCWLTCEGTPKCLYYLLILSGYLKLTFVVTWGRRPLWSDLSGHLNNEDVVLSGDCRTSVKIICLAVAVASTTLCALCSCCSSSILPIS